MFQPSNQSCANCAYLEETAQDEYDDPENPSGYCTNPVDNEPYGGHWTHHHSWCALWSSREEYEATLRARDAAPPPSR
jgi:hypothetical protein